VLPELVLEGVDEGRGADDGGVEMFAVPPPSGEFCGGVEGFFGRVPVDDTLAQGDGAGVGADELGDDGDHRRDDVRHAL
jgi:hypothetical protein